MSGLVARAACADDIPDLLIPALPRVDNALRLARELARQESEFTIALGLRFNSEREILVDAAFMPEVAVTPAELLLPSLLAPLQPHPQPVSSADAIADRAVAFA